MGASSLPLLWISLVEQLICCLGRGSWGMHGVLLRPQQKLEKSWCLCARLYIDALFCRSTTHCCAPKISFFAQQWFTCPPLTFNPHWEAIRRSYQRQYQSRWWWNTCLLRASQGSAKAKQAGSGHTGYVDVCDTSISSGWVEPGLNSAHKMKQHIIMCLKPGHSFFWLAALLQCWIIIIF